MGFFITEEKELPEFSNQDANKVLKVDPSGVYLQWLQETTTPAELPSQTGNSGRLLTTNGTTPSWTNGPIGLGTTGAATPMLWFGASNNGFAEAWTAGGGATGVSAITNGAVCCTFQSGAIRLPGGNPIRSNGNAAARFQFTSDVPNMQNNVTAGTTGTDRIVNVSSANWASTSLDLVCSNTNDTPGALNASSMGIEIKQNQIVFNGAGTTASGTTLPARVTRMSISNAEVTTSLPLAVSNYITASSIIIATTGFVMNQAGTTTAQAYTFRNFDSTDANRNNTNRQGIYSPAIGAIAISTNSISAGTTAGSTAGRPDAVERFRVDDNFVTVTNSLNLNRVGSASEPNILFGDNTTIPATSRTGIYGSDDNIFFSTGGVQRFSISNANAAISGNLIMSTPAVGVTGANGGIGVVASVGNTAGLYSTSNTNSGIRFQDTNSNVRILTNGMNVIDCTNVGGVGVVSMEEAIIMKKAVRCPITSRNHTSIPIGATSSMMIRVLISDNVPSAFDLPNLGATLTGQTHVIIPYKDAASTGTLNMWTGGVTGHAIHVMHNSTKTVVTGSSTYPLIEGGVYTCVWHHITTTAGLLQGIWYVWIDGLSTNTVSDPFVVASTIDFFSSGSAIARIQGDNAGVNSSMSMIINGTTNIKYTVDNTEVQNSLRLFKAPITDWIIVDSSTHNVSRNSPSKIILSKASTGSSSATVVFPTSDSAPDGLTIQVMVWMLPDRTGTGTQRVRFDSASPTNNAFVLGSSGTGIALGGTTYTVTEGTNFTATNFRTTIGRWMVDATRFNCTPALTAA